MSEFYFSGNNVVYAGGIGITAAVLFVYFGNIIPAILVFSGLFLAWRILEHYGVSYNLKVESNVEQQRIQTTLEIQKKFTDYSLYVGNSMIDKSNRELDFSNQVGKLSLEETNTEILAAKNKHELNLQGRLNFVKQKQVDLTANVKKKTKAELNAIKLSENEKIEKQRKMASDQVAKKQDEFNKETKNLSHVIKNARENSQYKIKMYRASEKW